MKRSVGISKMKIQNVYHLNKLGYDPECIIGFFCSPERPVEIARKYPHLHVISGTEGTYVNHFAPGHDFYYLSAGDPDPNIEIYAEPFTEECLQRTIAIFKDGDKQEITDPVELAAVRFFSGLVSDKSLWEIEREKKAKARTKKSTKH